MQASLTFPPEGNLIAGDNPVYIGNVNRGESRTVNWTLVFTSSGLFDLNVNFSGYRVDIDEYVERHGYATVTVIIGVLSPQNMTYTQDFVPLTFCVIELAGWIGYSLDRQENITISENRTISDLPEGSHTLIVYANDTVGNMGSDVVYFTVDISSPIIQTPTRTPEGDIEPYQEVAISANVTDEITDVEMVILSFQNNTSWYNITMSLNPITGLYGEKIPGQPAGTFVKYEIIAYDKAGNFDVKDNEGVYYNYSVIPEFPSTLILVLLLTAATLCMVLAKKKLHLQIQ